MSALIFTGGIGENNKELREAVAEKIKCLGFKSVDKERNKSVEELFKSGKDVVDISSGSTENFRLLVIETDEEKEMVNQLISKI